MGVFRVTGPNFKVWGSSHVFGMGVARHSKFGVWIVTEVY